MSAPVSPKSKAITSVIASPVVDEVTPLLATPPTAQFIPHGTGEDIESRSVNESDEEREKKSGKAIFGILSVLLIGVFVSQADGSLVLATYGKISSEFNDLQNASWLVSSYMLAMCVSQVLYGKLSDIWGRKAMLQVAYFLFAIGSLFCGLGKSMPQLIAARAIQGIGGAGMVGLVSILVTDLVPLRDVASYRSYVNIVQTVGRASGGPIGGALAQTVGWRWAFIGQAPLTLIAMVLVAWKLEPNDIKKEHDSSHLQKLKRVDFPGAFFLSATILSCLLILDIGGEKVAWSSSLIFTLGATSIVSGVLFCLIEKHWAKEPIFPLHLLTHFGVVTSYVLLALFMASQIALMQFIPLYFEVTKNANMAAGGAYMVPAIMGNTLGGLLTGAYIKRTGRYKRPINIAGVSGCLCFTLLLTTWRGNTPVWQSFFVFFGGFATGIAYSAVFVALANSVEEKDMAIAGSALYLSGNFGAVTGLSAASAVFQTTLRSGLASALAGRADGKKVAKKALENVEFVQKLTGKLRELVIGAYVFSFRTSFGLSLACCVTALIVGSIVRERRISR